ncbi:uncharacterized protein LOC110443240 [Mizuhopecten yessoensis]|uniref:uncharacterized protein LOC110443240 n=1 Tax=Mizuhopecten yessoensis TaxID=6573 RepID=UPI000B45DD38|nr:uncharacterized protein LOC110443240 [Mizuhopecten yessoensis]
MSSTTSRKTAATLSPLLLRKGIKGIAGDVKSVKPLGSGDLLIEVFRKQQAINLLGTTSFGGISVIVKAHPSLNSSEGVIRYPALRNDADAAILEYFQEEEIPVSEVRRILSKKNNKLVPTDTFVLTFATPSLPSAVVSGYQRCSVSVYIPNPLGCRNCQKYGHHEKDVGGGPFASTVVVKVMRTKATVILPTCVMLIVRESMLLRLETVLPVIARERYCGSNIPETSPFPRLGG